MKTDVVAILTAAQTAAVAQVSSVYDNLISQVNALPEDPSVTDLQSQLASVQAIVTADASTLTDEKSKEAKLQAKLDAIQAALNA